MVVYTAIFGRYDRPVRPIHTGGCRHVLITDQPSLHAPGWEMVVTNREFSNAARENRKYKLQPHAFFPGQRTIYIDGNIHLLMPPDALLAELQARAGGDYPLFTLRHTLNHTLADEFDWVAKEGIVDKNMLAKQRERYERLNVPMTLPAAQACLLVSRSDSKPLYEAWWPEVREYAHRDQLSFPYARWVTNTDVYLCGRPHFRTLFKHRPHAKPQLKDAT